MHPGFPVTPVFPIHFWMYGGEEGSRKFREVLSGSPSPTEPAYISGHFLFFPFFPYIFGCMEEGSRKFREVLSGRSEGILDFPLLLFFPYIFGCIEGRRDPGNSGRSSREALPRRNRPRFQATFCFFPFFPYIFGTQKCMERRRDPGNLGGPLPKNVTFPNFRDRSQKTSKTLKK